MFSLKKSKFIYYVLIVISILVLVGCSSENRAKSPKKAKFKIVDETYKILVNGEWKHYDSNLGENLCISFLKNGEFYYHCECGEPVGDSDCYDKYEYKKGGKLRIYMSEDKNDNKEIKILHYNDKCLNIELDGENIEFYNAKKSDNTFVHMYMYGCEKCNKELEKYSGYDSVISIDKKSNEMIVAPFDYEKGKDDKGYLRFVKLADNVQIYKLDIASETDDAGNLKEHKCSYKKVDDKDIEKTIDKFSKCALITYNKNAEVDKVIFYKEKLKENM